MCMQCGMGVDETVERMFLDETVERMFLECEGYPN